MRVSIISCVYWPEPVVSARTSGSLAEELAKKDNSVRILTGFPNRPGGRLYEGYHRSFCMRERAAEGYSVVRLFSFFSAQSNLASRFLENISFGLTSGVALLFAKKPDVVYGNTWPIFAQGILAAVCRLRRIPLVLSVQDVYPESLLIQRRLPEGWGWTAHILRRLDSWIVHHCTALIVISERFREIYVEDRMMQPNLVHVVPNWTDFDESSTCASHSALRATYQIPEEAFLVVYGGNIGVASGIEMVIRAFHALRQSEDIYLLVAGEGSMLGRCRQLTREMDLLRVSFHSPWLRGDTLPLLDRADLLILPTFGEQSLVSVPSKLITYMMASRPVLAVAAPDSEVARVINDADCGWVISNADGLAEWIRKIAALPSHDLNCRGQRGKEYAYHRFSKEANIGKIIDLIEGAALSSAGQKGDR